MTVDRLSFSHCKFSVDWLGSGFKYELAQILGYDFVRRHLDFLCQHSNRKPVLALASYNTACWQALQFFTRPKIEVSITPRLPVDPQIVPSVVLRFLLPSGKRLQEITMQAITLTARRSSVERLAMQVKLDGQEPPMHMNWGMGQRTEDATSIAAQMGPRYISLEKNDHYTVWVWVAARTIEDDQTLLYNVEGSLPVNLETAKEPFIDFDIHFISVESKPSKLRLNIKSWEELNLTFRN